MSHTAIYQFQLEARFETRFFSNTRGGVTLESLTYPMPNDEMGAAIAMIICVIVDMLSITLNYI